MTFDGAKRLVRRLAALRETQQRIAVISEEADRLGMEAFADLLAVLLDRASTNKQDSDQLALVSAMGYLESEFFDDDRRNELLEACLSAQHQKLFRLLSSPQEHIEEGTERVPDYGSGRTLTLGERKSLARRPNRQILERVLADPHPQVIRNVLRNPKITELDVIRMVTKRPNHAKVLREIFQNSKWIARYRIKLALARNPYTPAAIALKLLPQLMKQDLEEILEDQGIHPFVIVSCRRLIEGEVAPVQDDDPDVDPPTIH